MINKPQRRIKKAFSGRRVRNELLPSRIALQNVLIAQDEERRPGSGQGDIHPPSVG